MLQQSPDVGTVRAVLSRACRAPSLHNSQPWRWRWDGATLDLFVDADRLLPATDAFNRQGILACGALLDHAQVAWAAAGWAARTARCPEPGDRALLATLSFAGQCEPHEADRQHSDAIDRRYTDRAPLAAPEAWAELEVRLRNLCRRHNSHVHTVDEGRRGELDQLSRTTATVRRHDPLYGKELVWWTGSGIQEAGGIPAERLPAPAVAARVPSERSFPPGPLGAGFGDIVPDAATIVVLSSTDDTVESLLHCGEALSAVLLETTVAGMSSCVLTHMTELPSARAHVTELVGDPFPQVLVRIGRAVAPPPPRTPRRGTGEILEVAPPHH